MEEQKLVAKGPIFEFIKQQTDGINLANDVKEIMIDYLNSNLQSEINQLCDWFIDVAKLQDKRTIQEKEWNFIIDKLVRK